MATLRHYRPASPGQVKCGCAAVQASLGMVPGYRGHRLSVAIRQGAQSVIFPKR
jgi:hypothetical protein